MEDMGTEADTAATDNGVIGAMRNQSAMEQSCRRQQARRLMKATVTPPALNKGSGTGTDAESIPILRRPKT
jgi:hypothetical protein